MRRPSFREQEALDAKAMKEAKQAAMSTRKDAGPSTTRGPSRSTSRGVSESRDSPTAATPVTPMTLASGPSTARALVNVASRDKGKAIGGGANTTAGRDKELAAGCNTDRVSHQDKERAASHGGTIVGDAPGSKRPTSDVAKDTTDATIPKKQRMTPLHLSMPVSVSMAPGAFHDNVAAAAALFSGITLLTEHLPSPSALIRRDSYADMSLRGAKFFSYVNSMVLGYEADSKRDLAAVHEARAESRKFQKKFEDLEAKSLAEREKAARETRVLESKFVCLEKSYKEARDEITVLKHGITKRESVIEERQRVIDTSTEVHNSHVASVVADAKREMIEGFREQMTRAKGKLKLFSGKVSTKMAHLAQVDANIELVELLQGEDPPTLIEEMKKLEARKLKYVGAYEDFDNVAAALKAELVISDSAGGLTSGEPIELSASRVGVCDQFGTNGGNPDLVVLDTRVRDGGTGRSPAEGAEVIDPVPDGSSELAVTAESNGIP